MMLNKILNIDKVYTRDTPSASVVCTSKLNVHLPTYGVLFTALVSFDLYLVIYFNLIVMGHILYLRRLGCGCGRRLVTGSCVIREMTQTGCLWSTL